MFVYLRICNVCRPSMFKNPNMGLVVCNFAIVYKVLNTKMFISNCCAVISTNAVLQK